MKTLDAAKGKWDFIYSQFNLRITGNKHIDCPICGGKKKMRITDKWQNGNWICVCGAGDGLKLLQEITGHSFYDVCARVDSLIGNSYEQEVISRPDYQAQLKMHWRTLKPIKGTHAEEYLNNRGIFRLPKRAIKFNPAEMYMGEGAPCMYAVGTNQQLEPVQKHRTFFLGESKKKLMKKVDPDRDVPGECVAVKMFESDTCLGVAEGIETALSVHQMYELPMWSTMTAGYMEKFVAPMGVKHLKVYADMDQRSATGHMAAFACANRNLRANNDVERVTVLWPDQGDFNDVLVNFVGVNEMRFEK
jgi:putative DNA primase/helicase